MQFTATYVGIVLHCSVAVHVPIVVLQVTYSELLMDKLCTGNGESPLCLKAKGLPSTANVFSFSFFTHKKGTQLYSVLHALNTNV